MIRVLRATIVGGVVFLVPFVALAVVLGKAFAVMRKVADPVSRLIPIESIAAIALADLIAVVGLIAICLLAGVAARSSAGRQLAAKLEGAMLATIPGYQFVKGMADSLADSDDLAQSFTPVVARFDDYAQIAFEVDRANSGKVVVYLPGAPNPWSGSVVYVDPERIEKLDMTVAAAVRIIRQLGRDSTEQSDALGQLSDG